MRTPLQEPCNDIYLEKVKQLRLENLIRDVPWAIHPGVEKCLSIYMKIYKSYIKEIDLIHVNDWNRSAEGAKGWRQLATDDCNFPSTSRTWRPSSPQP